LDCSAVLAVALTSRGFAIANPFVSGPRRRSSNKIAYSEFLNQLNTPFSIKTRSGPAVPVVLTEARNRGEKRVDRNGRATKDAANEKFSLIFFGDRAEMLTQDTYWISHPQLGQFALFIAPIYTRDPAKIRYQAVINRPHIQSNEG